MEFQQRLYDLRKKAGLSQEELANLLGVTRQAVQKWEGGSSRPDLENLVSLAQYFNVTLDWLVTGQEGEPAAAATVVNHYHYDRWHYEYKSSRTFLGLPLVHIKLGQGLCRARGVVAVGNVATGLVALGGFSAGLFSLGGISLGLLLALGGLSVGGLAAGGLAVGGIALGGCAIGWVAMGGAALGEYAVGGAAVASKIAIGGAATGPLAIGNQVSGAVTFQTDGVLSPEILSRAIARAAPGAPQWLQRLLLFLAAAK